MRAPAGILRTPACTPSRFFFQRTFTRDGSLPSPGRFISLEFPAGPTPRRSLRSGPPPPAPSPSVKVFPPGVVSQPSSRISGRLRSSTREGANSAPPSSVVLLSLALGLPGLGSWDTSTGPLAFFWGLGSPSPGTPRGLPPHVAFAPYLLLGACSYTTCAG